MHRPPMDWEAAERRHDPATIEGRIWAGLRELVEARRSTRAVHARGRIEPLATGNPHVFALRREHAGERMLLLANFSAVEQTVEDGGTLGPYEFRWLA
jgi:amylosucrase